jgi:hypothetical protein
MSMECSRPVPIGQVGRIALISVFSFEQPTPVSGPVSLVSPWCALRIIAAITQETVIMRIIHHLQLASVPHLLHLPVVAKQYTLSTKLTTWRMVS